MRTAGGFSGIIRDGYSDELDNIKMHSSEARTWMANLESKERERTGIKTLKVSYNKVFGYYIEISRGSASSAPENYIRKQTLVNAERFITPEMKEYETLILNADDNIHQIELRLFDQICHEISQYMDEILNNCYVRLQTLKIEPTRENMEILANERLLPKWQDSNDSARS